MQYFYHFEMLAAVLLYFTAFYEYYFIFKFNGKELPKSGTPQNIEVINNSVNIIFKEKFGELIIFLYPISFILVALLTLFIFYSNNIINSYYLYNFVIISVMIISAHVVIPYYFNYLKYAEQAIMKDYSLIDWIDKSFRIVERSETEKKDKNFSFEEIDLFRAERFGKDNFDRYNDSVKIFIERTSLNEFELISEKEYISIVPFLTNHNCFVKKDNKLVELILSEDSYELSYVTFGLKSMYYSFFNKVDLNVIFLSRFFEVTMFFVIINTLLILSNQI